MIARIACMVRPLAKSAVCPSCSLEFKRGKNVYRMLGGRAPVHQRVCLSCAKFAVPLLARDAHTACESCGMNLRRQCEVCIAEKEKSQETDPKAEIERLGSWMVGRMGVKDAVRALRVAMHAEALARVRGNRKAAAKLLGVDRRLVQALSGKD